MKKLFFVALIITLCVAVAGCGAQEQTKPTETTSSTEMTGSQDGTYEIRITGDEDNEAAAQLLDLVNQYRSGQGMAALEWNDTPAEMLRVRAPLYERFADEVIDNNGTLEETVRAILDLL